MRVTISFEKDSIGKILANIRVRTLYVQGKEIFMPHEKRLIEIIFQKIFSKFAFIFLGQSFRLDVITY